MFAGKKSAQIREILISESAWEEMTCLFAPSQGKGMFYNCNAYKERYEDCCLGKMKRGDSSKDKGLLKALSYITKIDACARLLLPGNARTFGRGEVRSLKKKKRT